MTTIADLLTRCSFYLQDTDQAAWSDATKQMTLLDVIQQLSRQEVFGEVLWEQGVTGTAVYTFPPSWVRVEELVYDGRSLRQVTDASLARQARAWQGRSGRPQVYTVVTEAPYTVRVVPTPVLTGSAVPQQPGLPVMQREQQNFLAFAWVNPQGDEEALYVPAMLEDVVVFLTVAQLCRQASEWQDIPKSQVFQHLAQFALTQIQGGEG